MVAKFWKTKKRFKKLFVFPPFILGISVLLIIGFLALSNWKIIQKRVEFNNKIEEFKNEFQELEKRNQTLKAEISQIQTKESLEKMAREQLNYQKQGEITVSIIKDIKDEKGEEKNKKGLWAKIFEIFSRD